MRSRPYGLFFWLYAAAAIGMTTPEFPVPEDAPPEALERYRTDVVVIVDISRQELAHYRDGKLVKVYPVSTSEKGVGNREGSLQTPTGLHVVREKIGQQAPLLAIFKSRQPTGELASIETAPRHLDKDLVTTRILWLSGLEPGVNQGGDVDSYQRYIYIHGTPEEGLIGQPASHGCVRMKNRDIVELFSQIPEGALVWIVEHSRIPGKT